jgi:hypothetical protein
VRRFDESCSTWCLLALGAHHACDIGRWHGAYPRKIAPGPGIYSKGTHKGPEKRHTDVYELFRTQARTRDERVSANVDRFSCASSRSWELSELSPRV